MAIRIQLRRDTAANWASANPVLRAGEIGIETDTLKFKVGNGSSAWNSITAYANVVPGDLNTTLNDYVLVTDIGTTVAGLDGNQNLYIPNDSIIFEGATPDSYELTLVATDPTADRTITLPDATGTIALTSNIPSNTDGLNEGTTNKYFTDERAQDAAAAALNAGTHTNITVTYDDNAGSISLAAAPGYTDEQARDAIATALTAGTGITVTPNDNADTITVAVDSTIATKTYADNAASTAASTAVSNLVASAPSALDTLNELAQALGNDANFSTSVTTALGNKQDKVSGVSDTEIGYLDGVTSAIQTQLDGKSATGHTHTASNVTDFNEAAQDAVAQALANGTHTNISVSYNDETNAISLTGAVTYTDENAQDAVGNAVGNGLDYDDNTGAISVDPSEFALNAVGAPTANVSMANYKITSLAEPEQASDAATKSYVDAATAGLNVHDSVKAATTTNINLSTDVENGDLLDGVTLATGNRILVKNQTTKSENGVYVVSVSGAPTRATDYDSAGEVDAGDFIFVEGGNINGKTGWVQVNTITTIGSDNIEFTQFSGAGTYKAGNGLTLTGDTFSINTNTTVDLNTAQTLTNKTLTSPTIGGTGAVFSGATSGNITVLATGTAGTNTITLPARTGTVITSADTGTVTSTMIADGTIVNADINASAAIALSKLATDPLARANHTGTQTASTISDFNTQVRTNRLDQMAAPTASVSLNSQKITSLATPTADTDAATKAYVDATAQGLDVKQSVRFATVPGYTLSADPATVLYNGNGYPGGSGLGLFVTGDRILITADSSDARYNGIWVVSSGFGVPAVRATDADSFAKINKGSFVFVESGSNAGKGYVVTATVETGAIGTTGTSLTWTQFSGAGTFTAGTGLTLTGSAFSIDTGTTVDLSTAQTLSNKTLTAPRFASAGEIDDANGNELIKFSSTVASAVNEITITNAATGNTPSISATGDNTNISLNLVAKGTGTVQAGGVTVATISGSQTLTNKTINGANNTLTVRLANDVTGTLPVGNGGTNITTYATGDILYASATNTLSKLAAGTNGHILTLSSGVPTWAAAPVSLPSQTGNAGKFLTTNGTTATWSDTPIITGTATITANTATTIDTNALTGFTSIEYMVSLKQGSKIRTSKVIVQTDGTSVDMTEFAITETGGTMSGVVVSATASAGNALLQVTVTDAATTNVSVKFSEVKL